jgi:hypothetical protein
VLYGAPETCIDSATRLGNTLGTSTYGCEVVGSWLNFELTEIKLIRPIGRVTRLETELEVVNVWSLQGVGFGGLFQQRRELEVKFTTEFVSKEPRNGGHRTFLGYLSCNE